MTIFDCIPVATMVAMYDHTMSEKELEDEIFEIDCEVRECYLQGEPIPSIILERRSLLLHLLKSVRARRN